jgi:hypothetical protein
MAKKKKKKKEDIEIEKTESEPEIETETVSDKDHYIDNKQFYAEMVEWKKLCKEAEETDDPRPPVTEYIGQCFINIAEHLSRKSNFVNYPYRDEMVADGIENCLMYAHNFDPKKSKNPFSYFTQIIYYAFLRRIEKEKKQAYVKFKMTEILDDGSFHKWFKENYFEKDTVQDAMTEHFNISENDIKKFEPKKKRKKKNKK